jgi:hypothetical protein
MKSPPAKRLETDHPKPLARAHIEDELQAKRPVVFFFNMPQKKVIKSSREAIMTKTGIRQDDFDAILVSELETLWKGEKRLRRMYPRLQRKPQLLELFLCELAQLQQRAERLTAVLSPCEIFQPAEVTFPGSTARPAA